MSVREREKRREDEEEARSSAQTPQGSRVCLQTFTTELPNDWRVKIQNVVRATTKQQKIKGCLLQMEVWRSQSNPSLLPIHKVSVLL